VDALRHPVLQTVPEDTVTPVALRGFQPEPDRPATKLKLYREN